MGIKDLNSLLKEKNTFTYVEKYHFKNQRIAMDFLNFLYICHSKAIKNIIQDIPADMLAEGKIDSNEVIQKTIHYFIDDLMAMLRFSIVPIVIFEGEPCSILKTQYAHIQREESRQKDKKSLIEWKGVFNDKYKMLFSRTYPLDKIACIHGVQRVLDTCGLPYLTCSTEAEHLASALCKEGYVIATYTTDSDTVPLATPFNISKQGTDEDPMSPIFRGLNIWTVRKQLELTQDQLIDLSILASCDYNKRVKMRTQNGSKSIGIKTAYMLIQKYGSISNLLEHETILNVEDLHYEECQTIFKSKPTKYLCPSFDPSQLNIKPRKIPSYDEFNEDIYYLCLLTQQLENVSTYYSLPS